MAEEAHKASLIDSAVGSLAEKIEHLISGGHDHHDHNVIQEWLNLHEWVEWVGGRGVSRGAFLIFLFIPTLIAASVLMPEFPTLVFSWLLLVFPVAAPIALISGFWIAWLWYVRSNFIFMRSKPILLEVKMPQEITKSPRAMELVFSNLWIRMSETTEIDKYWSGGSRPVFSFELVSLGGQVHFYIWVQREFLRNIVESNFYAQYPEVEIVEVEDYATSFHYDHHKHQAFVGNYVFEAVGHVKKEEERINAYPIKTYIDFELDKDPKEEFKVEPLASVLEVLSALNPDEQAWVQIVIHAHLKSKWKEIVENEVEKIRRESTQLKDLEGDKEDEDSVGFPRPTWKQTEQIRSMERNLGKLPFEFGARMIYLAPRGKLRSAEYTAIRWIFRPFANPNYQIMLRPRFAHNDFDWPWQDFRDIRWEHETHRYIDAYRRRQVFHPPWQSWVNITSVEVLASIWHPPSRTIKTPGLQRISSSKGEPPPNLPM